MSTPPGLPPFTPPSDSEPAGAAAGAGKTDKTGATSSEKSSTTPGVSKEIQKKLLENGGKQKVEKEDATLERSQVAKNPPNVRIVRVTKDVGPQTIILPARGREAANLPSQQFDPSIRPPRAQGQPISPSKPFSNPPAALATPPSQPRASPLQAKLGQIPKPKPLTLPPVSTPPAQSTSTPSTPQAPKRVEADTFSPEYRKELAKRRGQPKNAQAITQSAPRSEIKIKNTELRAQTNLEAYKSRDKTSAEGIKREGLVQGKLQELHQTEKKYRETLTTFTNEDINILHEAGILTHSGLAELQEGLNALKAISNTNAKIEADLGNLKNQDLDQAPKLLDQVYSRERCSEIATNYTTVTKNHNRYETIVNSAKQKIDNRMKEHIEKYKTLDKQIKNIKKSKSNQAKIQELTTQLVHEKTKIDECKFLKGKIDKVKLETQVSETNLKAASKGAVLKTGGQTQRSLSEVFIAPVRRLVQTEGFITEITERTASSKGDLKTSPFYDVYTRIRETNAKVNLANPKEEIPQIKSERENIIKQGAKTITKGVNAIGEGAKAIKKRLLGQ